MVSVTQVIDYIASCIFITIVKWGFCMLPVSCILPLPHVQNFKSRKSTRLEEAFAITMFRFAFLREILQARARTTSPFLAQYAKLTGACLACGSRLLPIVDTTLCLFSRLLEIRATSWYSQ